MASSEAVIESQDKIAMLGREAYTDSKFDLTELPMYDSSTLETQEFELRPNGSADLENRFNSPNENIEFEYIGNEAYDPSNIYFRMESYVRRSDGSNFLASDQLTALTGNICDVFSRLEFYIGSEKVEDLNFVGKADTVLKLLHTSAEWTRSSGSVMGWMPSLTSATLATDTNGTARRDRTVPTAAAGVARKTQYFAFTLPISFFRENNKIVKNVSWRLRLFRNEDKYLFEKGDGADSGIPQLKITRLSCFIPTIKMSLARQLAYDQSIVSDYLLQYTGVYADKRQLGTQQDVNEQLASFPSCPSKIFIMFQNVAREAALLAGATAHANPLHFDHLQVGSFELVVNGKKRIPFTSQNMDFTTGNYAHIMRNTLACSGALTAFDAGSCLNYENFGAYYPIFGFDVKNSHSSNIPELNKTATKVDINIHFNTAPASPYMYIVALFDNVVSIKGNTNIARVIYGK